jgi:predicted RNA-binding Zn-ribbon protein involved in translation (DUF1610 family)
LAHKGRQGGKKYQCLQCAAEFDDIKGHRDHVEGHALEKPFKCGKCGLHLTNASGLKRHLRRVHDKAGPMHKCLECSKTFFERFDLSRHLKVHSVPKCDKCGKAKAKDKNHICKPVKVSDPELECTICHAQLDSKVKWGFHMWKHTKDPAYIQTETVVVVVAVADGVGVVGEVLPEAPPEAHASTSISKRAEEPLCLQMASKKRTRPLSSSVMAQPLNMQVIN